MGCEERTAAVERWGGMVWKLALARTANIDDAQDIFQEVFLRYFRNEHKLADDEHTKAWLIRCTINRAKSRMSSLMKNKTLPLETAERIGIEDDYREVYCSVLALPVKYRTVVHLYYYEQMSIAQIAAATGCAEGTVKAQLSRARAMLKKSLKGEIGL